MKPMQVAASVLAAAAIAGQAHAAMLVHDPVNYIKLIEQARTALNQLEELKAQLQQGKALYDSLNSASGVDLIARELGVPEVREFLPKLEALRAAADGDFTSLGEIGSRAEEIRQAWRVLSPELASARTHDLQDDGARAARDLAIGEAVAKAGDERLAGLEELNEALASAKDARAVLDLQARAAAEGALIANDQMRLQGLLMSQEAEARLERQRERERTEQERAERMAYFHRSFAP